MQWTYFSRKEDLQDIAGEMESGVGNINVQFATFKYEVNNVYPYKTHWPTVKNANSIEKMTTIFMKEIEQPKDQGSDAQKSRIEKAKIIFKGMGEINE